MSMDGQYVAKSQGWRCGECPWMDGQIIAPALSALPPSVVVVCRKEPGMAVRLCPGMDGIPQGAKEAVRLCPGMDGIPQGAKEAVRL